MAEVNHIMGKKLLIICFGLFMLLTIVKIIVDNKNLDENFKYTKARIIQIKPVKGGKAIIYEFCVNGKTYQGSKISYSVDENIIGKFYDVKYDPDNPTNGNLELDK